MDALDLAIAQANGEIKRNLARVGNFTSSGIGALMSNGKKTGSLGQPALTYVRKKNIERRLGRALVEDVNARATQWGNLCERRVIELLGSDYSASSQVTVDHPDINFWKGSPDAKKKDSITEIKCPFTLLSFCDMIDAFERGVSIEDSVAIFRDIDQKTELYYWQMVSNAVLLGKDYAELVIYMPYKSELDVIQEMASTAAQDGMNVKWVYWALHDELPYLLDDGYYKNLNVFRFRVPQEDKEALTERVIEAGKLLTPFTQ